MRWLTPERLSILRSSRAWNATSSTTSRTNGGTSIGCSAVDPGFLRGDRHRLLAAGHVVRADLGADAILERRDDLAARRVVLGVGGEEHHDVERQPDREAFDLDVALLQDVEQADLDLAGEIGQLVDREDARDWRAAAGRSASPARSPAAARRAPP